MGLFGKKKLAGDGTRATGHAYVMEVHESALLRGLSKDTYHQASGSSEHTKFRLKVTPDDGEAEFESTASVWGDVGLLRPGQTTYVLYDRGETDDCEIDVDRLASEFSPTDAGHRRMTTPSGRASRRAARAGAGGLPPEVQAATERRGPSQS